MNIENIVKELIEAKKAYYDGEPIMSDASFDTLEEKLRKLDPANDYFHIVGVSLGNIKEKVTHKIPMLSCDKAKTFEDVIKWAKKHGTVDEMFIIEPKIDGMSCALIYKNGKLIQICTRGDGLIGQDVTHLSNYIDVPKKIDIKTGRIEIRGELYLPKDTKTPNPDKKPLRNVCVGMVGRKDYKLDDLRFVHFIAYQIIGAEMNLESYKMSWLSNNHFEVIGYEIMKLDRIEGYRENYVNELRDKWNYETDGLVVCVNDNSLWDSIDSKYEIRKYHHYNIAWKPESETAETILESIQWQISRSGRLTPVAIFQTVNIGGANISRASLTCYGTFMDMKLEKGDRILVSKANEVIPYVEKNLSKGTSQRGK